MASRLEYLVREQQQRVNEGIMKKTSSNRRPKPDEMRREYRFDYRKSHPNRFASLINGRAVAIVLDPDVASVFGSSESVNSLLRSVINALPKVAKA
jgi:hypothetical protein